MSDDVEIEIRPARAEGDGYYTSSALQWALLCPHMNTTAKVVYCTLCDLVTSRTAIRKIRLSELAAMIPTGAVAVGEKPKFMSEDGLRKVLRQISDVGQIEAGDGSKLKLTSRKGAEYSIQIWLYPRHECGCFRNVSEALYVHRGEEPRWPLANPGPNRDQPVDKSITEGESGPNRDQPGPNRDQPGPNRLKNQGLTCDNANTLIPSPNPSPTPKTGCGVGSTTTSGSGGSGAEAADAADNTEIIDAEIVEDDTDGLFAETDVDDPAAAAAAEKEQRRNDAIERELLQRRAKVVEKEHAEAAAAEQQRNQPNRYPPVDYRGPQYGGTGWARTDAPPAAPKAPQQRTDSKPKRKPEPGTEEIPFPERFHLTTVMAQKAKALFPELHIDLEFEAFASHAREHNRTSANWHEAWHRWLVKGEKDRREGVKRSRGFAPRGQQGMTNHEAKLARNHAVVERLKERRAAGVKNPFLPEDHPNQPQPQRPALPGSHKTNPFFQSTPQIPAEDQE